jgi:hypothetical protein
VRLVRPLSVPALLALALLAPAPSAAETYRATAEFESARTLGTGSVELVLDLDRPTPVEEALGLRDVLERGGSELLRAALAGRRDGWIRMGGLEIPIALVVVAPIEDDGRHYLLVTERPLRLPTGPNETEDRRFPFGFVEFEVDGFGSGEGTFVAAAALAIDEEGRVAVSGDTEEPGRLTDVELED